MNENLRRSLAALATAFACLVLMSSPTSAATHTGTVTGGTLFATGQNGITESVSLGSGTGGTGCATTAVVDDGATGTTPDVTSFTSTGRFTLSTSGNHYVSVITRLGSTAGTLTGTTVTSASLTVRVDVFLALNNTSTATDCATTGTRVCRLVATVHFGGTVSSNPIVSSTTAALSAPNATIAVQPPCGVPFATFNGGVASISGLGLHATS